MKISCGFFGITILKKLPCRNVYGDGDKRRMLPNVFPDHYTGIAMYKSKMTHGRNKTRCKVSELQDPAELCWMQPAFRKKNLK